jgi:hypothetical protein
MVVDLRPWDIGDQMRMLGPDGIWVPFKTDRNITVGEIFSGICLSEQEVAKIDAKSGYNPNKKGLGWHLKRTAFLIRARLGGIRSFIDKKLHKYGWPPYSVVLVDQFQGHHEDGYGTMGVYNSYKEALVAARQISEDAIKRAGSIEGWLGMGDAGLIYDSKSRLIWDGVTAYQGKKSSTVKSA